MRVYAVRSDKKKYKRHYGDKQGHFESECRKERHGVLSSRRVRGGPSQIGIRTNKANQGKGAPQPPNQNKGPKGQARIRNHKVEKESQSSASMKFQKRVQRIQVRRIKGG